MPLSARISPTDKFVWGNFEIAKTRKLEKMVFVNSEFLNFEIEQIEVDTLTFENLKFENFET